MQAYILSEGDYSYASNVGVVVASEGLNFEKIIKDWLLEHIGPVPEYGPIQDHGSYGVRRREYNKKAVAAWPWFLAWCEAQGWQVYRAPETSDIWWFEDHH